MTLVIELNEVDFRYIREKRAIRTDQMEDIFNGIYNATSLQEYCETCCPYYPTEAEED